MVEGLLHTVADTLAKLPAIKRIPTEDGNFIEQITRAVCIPASVVQRYPEAELYGHCEHLAELYGCDLTRGVDGCLVFKLPE
jgi:hypothetical protein